MGGLPGALYYAIRMDITQKDAAFWLMIISPHNVSDNPKLAAGGVGYGRR